MREELFQAGKSTKASTKVPVRIRVRMLNLVLHAWRPSASAVAVLLALLLVWHGVYGKNGLLVWQQKRVEDQQLQKEIDGLNRENARLRDRVDRLKTSPDAIGVVARDKLHYAKPNEVIVTLPADEQTQPAAAGK
ncbi:MAG: septum formation initiator family protein [Terracidiphilus sp.]|jgi:cell division protein FtsB